MGSTAYSDVLSHVVNSPKQTVLVIQELLMQVCPNDCNACEYRVWCTNLHEAQRVVREVKNV